MLERAHHQLGDTDKNANISSVYVNLTLGRECIYENQEFFHHWHSTGLHDRQKNFENDPVCVSSLSLGNLDTFFRTVTNHNAIEYRGYPTG